MVVNSIEMSKEKKVSFGSERNKKKMETEDEEGGGGDIEPQNVE